MAKLRWAGSPMPPVSLRGLGTIPFAHGGHRLRKGALALPKEDPGPILCACPVPHLNLEASEPTPVRPTHGPQAFPFPGGPHGAIRIPLPHGRYCSRRTRVHVARVCVLGEPCGFDLHFTLEKQWFGLREETVGEKS